MNYSKQQNTLLNTLGVKRTNENTYQGPNNAIRLEGVGSCKDSLRKRPRKKIITQGLSRALAKVAREKNEIDWEKKYWRAWHCQTTLNTYKGRGYGDFCSLRHCTVCASIRKAHLVNQYKPIIEKWQKVKFVTLTSQAVKKHELKKRIDDMIRWFELLLDKCRKRSSRGNGIKLIGIKSLECNYNPIAKTYNPHFHFLVKGYEVSKIITVDWLQYWKRLGVAVSPMAQHSITIKSNKVDKGLIEVLKYGAKIFTDPNMKKSKDKTVLPVVYAAAMHEIFKAFDGRKLCTRFGFTLPKSNTVKTESKIVKEYDQFVFDQTLRNYVNIETGQIWKTVATTSTEDYLLENINTEKN